MIEQNDADQIKKEHRTAVLLGVAVFAASLLTYGIVANSFASDAFVEQSTQSPMIQGHFTILLYDADGNLKDKREIHNLIVSNGADTVAKNTFCGASGAFGFCSGGGAGADDKFSYIGVGKSTAGNSEGMNDLVTPVVRLNDTSGATFTANFTAGTEMRVQLSVPFLGGTDITAGNCTALPCAITEAGIFNASSGGKMWARQTFSAVNVDSGDTLTIQYNVDFDTATG